MKITQQAFFLIRLPISIRLQIKKIISSALYHYRRFDTKGGFEDEKSRKKDVIDVKIKKLLGRDLNPQHGG